MTTTLSTNRYDRYMPLLHKWLRNVALSVLMMASQMTANANPEPSLVPSEAPSDIPETQTPTPPDLTGTWYMRIRTATNARLAIIGTTKIRSTTHLLVHIENVNGTLTQTQKTCAVDTRPSRSISRTVLPKAFIDHLPVKSYPVELSLTEDGTWSYEADLRQQFVGYHGDLATDGIPEDDEHPSVFDWDEDGKPGASVLADIPLFGHIRIYMVQTNHTLISGQVLNEDRIEGRTRQRVLDQRTIGADNRLFAASPKLSVGTGHDRLELMRIDTPATCDDITRMAKGTF